MPQINITVDINDSIYLRDPLQTNLGKNILLHSIDLMADIGFEEFNFKKLATLMQSTEASIYRYFENKYMLLTYLVSWYWDFMHYMILVDTRHTTAPLIQLKQAIATLVNSLQSSVTPSYINHAKLHLLIVENATKVYHNKKVDALNQDGFYANYKKIVKTLSKMILDINSDFSYPKALATNLIEQSLNNEYYIQHLPSLTDAKSTDCNPRLETIEMINYMIDRQLAR